MYLLRNWELEKNYSLFHLFIKNFVSLLLYDFHEFEIFKGSYTEKLYNYIL
jgi:hypothetical protein